MMDSGTCGSGRFGWALAVAGLLLGSPGAALAAAKPARPRRDGADESALDGIAGRELRGHRDDQESRRRRRHRRRRPSSRSSVRMARLTKDLKGVQSVPALPATAIIAPVATVAVAPGTPSGVYYLWACADGPAQILEAKENNNCRKTAEKITVLALPDLVVTAITDPPAAAPPGQSFKVTNTVKNAGMVPSAAATTKYSLVSTSSAAQADLDGAQSVPGLTPGQTFTEEETVTDPGQYPPGRISAAGLRRRGDGGLRGRRGRQLPALGRDDPGDHAARPPPQHGDAGQCPGGRHARRHHRRRRGGPERGRRRCRRVDDHVRAGERGRHREEPEWDPGGPRPGQRHVHLDADDRDGPVRHAVRDLHGAGVHRCGGRRAGGFRCQ